MPWKGSAKGLWSPAMQGICKACSWMLSAACISLMSRPRKQTITGEPASNHVSVLLLQLQKVTKHWTWEPRQAVRNAKPTLAAYYVLIQCLSAKVRTGMWLMAQMGYGHVYFTDVVYTGSITCNEIHTDQVGFFAFLSCFLHSSRAAKHKRV